MSKIYEKNSKSFVYHPAPKCGCSTMKEVILRANGIDGRWKPAQEFPHRFIPCVKFNEVKADVKMCVVRDPIERFISGYSNRVLFHKDIKPIEFNKFVDNFEYFYKKVPIFRHHFTPQTWFVGKDPKYYTNIFFVNEMSDAIDFVSDFFEVEPVYVRNQTGGSNLKPIPNEKQKEFIRDFYKEDYRFLRKMEQP